MTHDQEFYFYRKAHNLWGLDILLNPLLETLRGCKTLEPNYASCLPKLRQVETIKFFLESTKFSKEDQASLKIIKDYLYDPAFFERGYDKIIRDLKSVLDNAPDENESQYITRIGVEDIEDGSYLGMILHSMNNIGFDSSGFGSRVHFVNRSFTISAHLPPGDKTLEEIIKESFADKEDWPWMNSIDLDLKYNLSTEGKNYSIFVPQAIYLNFHYDSGDEDNSCCISPDATIEMALKFYSRRSGKSYTGYMHDLFTKWYNEQHD
jgi:hypothetical protein